VASEIPSCLVHRIGERANARDVDRGIGAAVVLESEAPILSARLDAWKELCADPVEHAAKRGRIRAWLHFIHGQFGQCRSDAARTDRGDRAL
jgi:hypothetical protein